MKYTVHVYAVVRIKVVGVDADSQVAAIEKVNEVDFEAINRYNPEHFARHEGFVTKPLPPNIAYVEADDREIENFLVDEENDPNFRKSMAYDRNMKPIRNGFCDKCGQIWPAAKEEASGRQQGAKAP